MGWSMVGKNQSVGETPVSNRATAAHKAAALSPAKPTPVVLHKSPIADESAARPIFQKSIERKRYIRAFARQLLAGLATLGAAYAIEEAKRRALVDPLVLDIGHFAAALLGGLLIVRALVFLFYAITRKDETLRFYKQGFVWRRGREGYKYPFSEVVSYYERGGGIYFAEDPIVQWGAHTIEISDGHIFRVSPRHGSLKRFARVMRSYIAHATAIQIGEQLRAGKAVKLHRALIVHTGGVETGKHEIAWRDLAVEIKRGRLVIRKRVLSRDQKHTHYRVVRRIPLGKVKNVGGFYDLAQGTIRNHIQKTPYKQGAR